MLRFSLAAIALNLALVAPAPGQAQNGNQPAADGTVAPAQARRGETTFKTHCAACHSAGQFTAIQYSRAWSERPVIELFEQLRDAMPQDNPGGLTRQEYIDVVLYLYRLNGAPEGNREVPPDDEAMKNTRIRLKPAGS